jgi:hypothetical protein
MTKPGKAARLRQKSLRFTLEIRWAYCIGENRGFKIHAPRRFSALSALRGTVASSLINHGAMVLEAEPRCQPALVAAFAGQRACGIGVQRSPL